MKNPALQTAIDYVQIGKDTRQALRPEHQTPKPKKKDNKNPKINNKHYRRMVKGISRSFGRR